MVQVAWGLALATLLAAGLGVGGNYDAVVDSSPFVILVEHEDDRHCLASLVSQRTAVSTASCASPTPSLGSGTRDVWAIASSLRGAKPRPSPTAAARRVTRLALAGNANDHADPSKDLALLQLEAPFDDAAKAIPIFMESTRGHFGNDSWLYALHALPPESGGNEVRMRVVNLTVEPSGRCAARVLHWAAAGKRQLCLAGAKGARLCEVAVSCVTESCAECCPRLVAAMTAGSAALTLLVRKAWLIGVVFFTAHIRGASVGGELFHEESKGPVDRTVDRPQKTDPATRPTVSSMVTLTGARGYNSAVAALTRNNLYVVVTSHRTIDFEPNRADFKMASEQSSPVPLKAGEYGDNAVEYPAGGDDAPAPVPRRTEAVTTPDPLTASTSPAPRPVPDAPAVLMSYTTVSSAAAAAPLEYNTDFNVYYLFLLMSQFI